MCRAGADVRQRSQGRRGGGRGSAAGAIYHGGVQKGVTSGLWLLPREHFAVAILTNLEGGGMLGLEALAGRIAGILLD